MWIQREMLLYLGNKILPVSCLDHIVVIPSMLIFDGILSKLWLIHYNITAYLLDLSKIDSSLYHFFGIIHHHIPIGRDDRR